MWVVPGATQRFIRNKSQGVRDKTLGLIVHVQVGNGELTGWYNNPGSQASSAWQVMKTGRIFQFGDPDADKFWTQGAGNPDYGAAEGEGHPNEPMTPEQIEGFAQIYAKGHLEEGWPFQLAEKPGDRGLGWHGMGGKAWGNHPNCPGAIRKAQRGAILARARQIVGGSPAVKEWFDMATEADLERVVRSVINIPKGQKVLDGADGAYLVRQFAWQNTTAEARYEGLLAAINALSKAVGTDAGDITAVVDKAVRDRLAQIKLAVADDAQPAT